MRTSRTSTSNSIGASESPLPIPNNPGLAGERLFAQFFSVGPTTPQACPPLGRSGTTCTLEDAMVTTIHKRRVSGPRVAALVSMVSCAWLICGSTSAQTTVNWMRGHVLEGRSGPAIAYDSTRQRVVLFGGNHSGGDLASDTWEWDGTTWQQQLPVTHPAARVTSVTYDEARRRIVLFGGYSRSGSFSDTWEWDGVNWTQRQPAVVPPAREDTASPMIVHANVWSCLAGSTSTTVSSPTHGSGTERIGRRGGRQRVPSAH